MHIHLAAVESSINPCACPAHLIMGIYFEVISLSFVSSLFPTALQNEVYKYPDLWVCPYNQYGCDDTSLEMGCVNSAWETEAGVPNAIFYPSDGTDQVATDQLQIEANAIDTGTEVRFTTRKAFPRSATCLL